MTPHPFLPVLACLSLLWFAATPAVAAGIDCAKAKAPVEKTICADDALRKADSDLGSAYDDIRQIPGQDKAGLLASQREWLKTRNACADKACLQATYAKRLAELQAPIKAQKEKNKAERARLHTLLGWSDECEQSFQELTADGDTYGLLLEGPGVTSYPLGDGRTVYAVQCLLGAYQAGYAMVLQEKADGKGTPLKFRQYDWDEKKVTHNEDAEMPGQFTFDPQTKELTVLSLARGLGDCGTLVRYAFPPQGGTKVVEAKLRECKDPPKAIDPKKWPLIKKP